MPGMHSTCSDMGLLLATCGGELTLVVPIKISPTMGNPMMTPWRIPWQIPLQVRFVSWSKTPLSHENPDDYPLVNIQKTMDRSTIFNGKINYIRLWPFSSSQTVSLPDDDPIFSHMFWGQSGVPTRIPAINITAWGQKMSQWKRCMFFFWRHGESIKKWCRKKPNIFPL